MRDLVDEYQAYGDPNLSTVGSITPGAQLQAMRPSRAVICAHCGAVFTAKDTRAKFCSNRCRQANKYLKAKGAKK